MSIYWLTRLDHIKNINNEIGGIGFFATVLTVLAIFAIFITTLVFYQEPPSDSNSYFHDGLRQARKIALKVLKFSLPVFLFSSLLSTCIRIFVPTTKEMAVIVAADWIAQKESMQDLPDKAVKVIDKFISQYLEEDDNAKNKQK